MKFCHINESLEESENFKVYKTIKKNKPGRSQFQKCIVKCSLEFYEKTLSCSQNHKTNHKSFFLRKLQ